MRLPKEIERAVQTLERANAGRGGQQVGPVTYHDLRDEIGAELAAKDAEIERLSMERDGMVAPEERDQWRAQYEREHAKLLRVEALAKNPERWMYAKDKRREILSALGLTGEEPR